MALIACPECTREISSCAPICPGCGVQTAQTSQTFASASVASPLLSDNNAAPLNLPVRITERLHSELPLSEIKKIVAQRFKAIEPKFQSDTLEFASKHAVLLRVFLTPIYTEGAYLLVVEHSFAKQSPWIIPARIVALGLIWYFASFWFAVGLLAFVLVLRGNVKFSNDKIAQCIQNLKNEVA